METATWILAICTALMAVGTFWLAADARKSSFRRIGVETWLELETRFDAKEMKKSRKKLAKQLSPYVPTKHDQITEEVLELFESIGTLYNRGLINIELADSSFSYYANHWWEAAKPYIDQERRKKHDDHSLYSEFQELVKKVRKHDPVIDEKALADFLNDEKKLK